jgi:hypothetical protein
MWRGVQYVRTIVTPSTLNSERQLIVRAITKQLTLDWQALTDAKRAAWNFYATQHIETTSLGDSKRLTGYNWFVRLNFLLVDAEFSNSLDDPPTRSMLFTPHAHDVRIIEADGVYTINFDLYSDPGDPGWDYFLDLWLTKPLSAGRKPKIQDAVHHSYNGGEDGTIIGTSPIVETGLYGLYFRLFDYYSGVRSTWMFEQMFVTIP